MTTTTIDRDTVLVQKADFLSSPLDDDLVLMSLETSSYYGMDALTRQVWEMFAEPHCVAEICAHLVTQFNVTQEQCEQDVLPFAQDLVNANLVEIASR